MANFSDSTLREYTDKVNSYSEFDMIQTSLGLLLLVIGLLYVALKLYVSFDSEGGTLGMVPVMDGAWFGPPIVWLGIAFLDRGMGCFGLPMWGYTVGCLTSVVGVGWLLGFVGRRGEVAHSPRIDPDDPPIHLHREKWARRKVFVGIAFLLLVLIGLPAAWAVWAFTHRVERNNPIADKWEEIDLGFQDQHFLPHKDTGLPANGLACLTRELKAPFEVDAGVLTKDMMATIKEQRGLAGLGDAKSFRAFLSHAFRATEMPTKIRFGTRYSAAAVAYQLEEVEGKIVCLGGPSSSSADLRQGPDISLKPTSIDNPARRRWVVLFVFPIDRYTDDTLGNDLAARVE